jgi:fimbrial chaperone protein
MQTFSLQLRHACLGGALAVTLAAPAAAGQLGISPTRAQLTPQHKVETLTLRNPGAEAIDYQVPVRQWRMDADGHWLLEDVPPGDALAVFPLAFRVPPGEAQVLRVGLLRAPPSGPEVAYRLLIRELPRERAAGEPLALSVLNQLSVPVFAGQEVLEPGASVDAGSFARNVWTLRVQSRAAHLAPDKATLRLVDAGGHALFEQDVSIGYVLAGASLPVSVTLPAQACRLAARFELHADGPLGHQQGTLPGPLPRPCAG